MSLQRKLAPEFNDYCVGFQVNEEDAFFRKLRQMVIDPVLTVKLNIDNLLDTIGKGEINNNKYFKLQNLV